MNTYEECERRLAELAPQAALACERANAPHATPGDIARNKRLSEQADKVARRLRKLMDAANERDRGY